jgi:hypothetical protein
MFFAFPKITLNRGLLESGGEGYVFCDFSPLKTV